MKTTSDLLTDILHCSSYYSMTKFSDTGLILELDIVVEGKFHILVGVIRTAEFYFSIVTEYNLDVYEFASYINVNKMCDLVAV